MFTLGSRGARIDAPPAINGLGVPAPDRFQPGRTHRASLGGSAVQRVAFAVGDVDDESMLRATQGAIAEVELTDEKPEWRLTPVAFDRFRLEGDGVPPGAMIKFEMTESDGSGRSRAQPRKDAPSGSRTDGAFDPLRLMRAEAWLAPPADRR